MSEVLDLVTLVSPVLVTVGFPLALAWQVLADLQPDGSGREAPTRVAGVSGAAQAFLALVAGTALTRWGAVPVPLWWLATWLLALGVAVLVLRWPALRPTAARPRLEVVGASVWVLLAVGMVSVIAR